MARVIGRQEWVNPQTGEVANFLVLGPKEVDMDFVKVFIPFVEEVFNDKELVGKAFRLLLWIMKNLNWNELKVTMTPSKVCKDLGICKWTYHKWKKILLEKGILFRDPESRETFYLKPYAIVRGSMFKTVFE
ncbi:TPA: hypothetical protein EYP13_00995 [Candidatus Micrarchaeota archaeon]|nr:hypothetical protein [Candidatus Micrarchaeota archaeon]